MYELTWRSLNELRSFAAPSIDVFDLHQHAPDAGPSKFGSITTAVRVAPALCVLATDTPLLLQDVLSGPALAPVATTTTRSERLIDALTPASSRNSSSLLHIRESTTSAPLSSSSALLHHEAPSTASDAIVDLTSLRAAPSSSALSSLQILSRPVVRLCDDGQDIALSLSLSHAVD